MTDLHTMSRADLVALSVQVAATIAAREAAERLGGSIIVATGKDEGTPFLAVDIRTNTPNGAAA